jgi:type IV secretory pathway TrbD component
MILFIVWWIAISLAIKMAKIDPGVFRSDALYVV